MNIKAEDMMKMRPGTMKLRRAISPSATGSYYFRCSKKPTVPQIAELEGHRWVSTVVVDRKWMAVQLNLTKLPSGYGEYTDSVMMQRLVETVVKSW